MRDDAVCVCDHPMLSHRWQQEWVEFARPPDPPPYYIEGVRRAYECRVPGCPCRTPTIKERNA